MRMLEFSLASNMESSTKTSKKSEQMTQEKIIAIFQRLRGEQRAIASKMSELDGEKTEHKSVINALKAVSPERKCFRLVGGVLVERQVKEVLPALEHNFKQLSALLEKLSEQLTEKGKELIAFKEKHNILLADEGVAKDSTPNSRSDSSKTGGGLLVT